MKNICFVCHGNICRSPAAEFALKKILVDSGKASRAGIWSRAVSREEEGSGVYPPMARALRARGIQPDASHRATLFCSDDYRRADAVYAMDRSNLRRLMTLTSGDPAGKIALLTEAAGFDGDIDDPWYSGDFDGALDQIIRCCKALAAKM